MNKLKREKERVMNKVKVKRLKEAYEQGLGKET